MHQYNKKTIKLLNNFHIRNEKKYYFTFKNILI